LDGGGVTHLIADPALVPGLVRHALDYINSGKLGLGARGAYAVWRFNWIHPFSGGNGRTARALAYLIFCAELGDLIGGEPSFPTLISQRRDDYIRALREADRAELDGQENFSAMTELVKGCMAEQVARFLSPEKPRRF
jgi:Fic family protein